MSATPYRERPDVERKFVVLELAERWIVVASRATLLGVTIGLCALTIACALRGYPWPTPTGIGGSSVVAGIAASLDRLRSK
jgi:hypothetical protein